MRQAILSFSLVWLVFLPGSSPAQSLKGKIQGASHVNLRSGPGIDQPSRAVLPEDEEVLVEREERGWYLVSSADGKRGYVHKTFVALSPGAERTGPPGETSAEASDERRSKDAELLSRQPVEETNAPQRMRLPLIKLLQGRAGDILWWLGVTLCIFILGWVCGGNYYLRRDQVKRKKIRF